MDHLLPTALIVGIDHFVAKRLVEELVKKDINVVGVGEYVDGLDSLENFKWVVDMGELEGNFSYIFDFRGELDDWEKTSIKANKTSIICVDDKEKASLLKEKLKKRDFNWRLVEAYGVYGVGMKEDSFLGRALCLAVRNKNLELPLVGRKFRLLAIDDLVEAILRASFLSGTEGENFLVLGRETDTEEVAQILIDEAKMTRLKVFQKDIEAYQGDEEKFLETQKKLRWKAELNFEDGIKETVQYFFTKLDEESRLKKKEEKKPKKIKQELVDIESIEVPVREVRKKDFEVMIDESETDVVGEEIVEEEAEEIIDDIPKFNLKQRLPENSDLPKEEEKIVMEEDLTRGKEEFVNQENIVIKKNEKTNVKRGKFWIFLLLFWLVLMLVVPISWVVNTYTGVKAIQKGLSLIKERKYSQAESLINKNLTRVESMDGKIDDLSLNGIKLIRNYQLGLKVLGDVLEVEKKAVSLAESADLIGDAVLKEKEIDWNGKLAEIREEMVEVENKLGVLQARLNGDITWLPASWKMGVQKQLATVQEIKYDLGSGVEVTKMLPELLGLDGKEKNYMILFQNESELRATGGFVGSYGIMTMRSGRLLSLDISDVYEADGQLKGHVEPPWEIKTHLGEANWYMRDANWNPNFPTAAADIQWFLNKELNRKVDGVVSIDLAVAKAMLAVIGELYVPDFKEKINKDNLYDQAEFYTETKFFPGSNQKASFLGSLGKQLFEEIRNLKPDKRLEMLQTLLNLLEKNEIQLAFNNKDLADLTASLGWDGSFYKGRCEAENCVNDYLYVVESNLGVNKANYFLNRNFEQVVEIGDGNLGRVLKLNYENTAKNTNWPGGNYKNYVRVYLPTDVDILQIMVVDGNDPNSKKVYNSDEIRIREVSGKKEVGFLVNVPVTKKRIVEIDYSTKINLVGKKNFSYVSYIQKQSGTGETPMVSLVSFPESWQPMQIQPSASLVGGKLLFNQKLDKDIKMGVEFGK